MSWRFESGVGFKKVARFWRALYTVVRPYFTRPCTFVTKTLQPSSRQALTWTRWTLVAIQRWCLFQRWYMLQRVKWKLALSIFWEQERELMFSTGLGTTHLHVTYIYIYIAQGDKIVPDIAKLLFAAGEIIPSHSLGKHYEWKYRLSTALLGTVTVPADVWELQQTPDLQSTCRQAVRKQSLEVSSVNLLCRKLNLPIPCVLQKYVLFNVTLDAPSSLDDNMEN